MMCLGGRKKIKLSKFVKRVAIGLDETQDPGRAKPLTDIQNKHKIHEEPDLRDDFKAQSRTFSEKLPTMALQWTTQPQ